MSKNKLTTGSKPIKFAEALSKVVLNEWKTESIYDNVSDITAELLEYWFSQDTCDNRNINFHEGQKQAILNAIYCYEVLKCKNIFDVYSIIIVTFALPNERVGNWQPPVCMVGVPARVGYG